MTASGSRTAYAELFSRSLEVVTGEKGIYACPLCLARFPIERAHELTWDHYPPQSVGGRRGDKVLVCKACQKAWTEVDSSLDVLKKRDEFRQQYPNAMPVVYSYPEHPKMRGMRFRAALTATPGSMVLMGRNEANPTSCVTAVERLMGYMVENGGWDGVKMQVSTDMRLTPSTKMINRAFVKAAYLAAFDQLGYSYVLAESLKPYRAQMQNPKQDVLPWKVVIHTAHPPDERHACLLALVREPTPARGLAVLLANYGITSTHVVLLPFAVAEPVHDYQRLADRGPSVHLNMLVLNFTRPILDERHVFIVDEMGEKFQIM